jgi:hypothetical protein
VLDYPPGYNFQPIHPPERGIQWQSYETIILSQDNGLHCANDDVGFTDSSIYSNYNLLHPLIVIVQRLEVEDQYTTLTMPPSSPPSSSQPLWIDNIPRELQPTIFQSRSTHELGVIENLRKPEINNAEW